MSYHVYISRPGFESSPISADEWLAAAGKCPLLQIVTTTSRKGKTHHSVRLAADPARRIWLLPTGLIEAQAPDAEVIEALFSVAPLLNAGVCSEKGRKFESPEDWHDKTRSYHAQLAAGQARVRKVRRQERAILLGKFAAALVVAVVLAWLMQKSAA